MWGSFYEPLGVTFSRFSLQPHGLETYFFSEICDFGCLHVTPGAEALRKKHQISQELATLTLP